jgi:DNA-binding IclR family transcriptional regulator
LLDDDTDFEMLRALRATPETGLAGLADALGVPRSNFGRRLDHQLLQHVTRLVEEGLVEQHGKRYRVSERGRDLLAERAFGDSL